MIKVSCIYKIQSISHPERCYIGSAIDIKERWARHYKDLKRGCHHSIKMQRHYDKYGKEDLVFSILISCDTNNLIENEQFFIDVYNPYFNTCKKAGSLLGCRWTVSDETKKKISEIKKGQIPWNKGKTGLYKHSEESLKKMSIAQKGNKSSVGRILSKGTKDKIRIAHLGKKLTEGHKEKLRGRISPMLGKKHSFGAIERMRIVKIGKKMPDETKKKHSISMIDRWSNGNIRGVQVINIKTRFIWDTILLAAQENDMHPSTLRKRLYGDLKNNTDLRLYFGSELLYIIKKYST